ncbi:hypothetical protein PRZ48_007364 [Zasmidium cellare]|uniref:Carboxylic ester hydrolase n=1 Tax=Zasmidium cellare TaxID=395010 RepID=A0ABR0EK45_ZASCE|nr:hypothetical protein PRZ48_007364 [Zasmidium cellare]
MHLQHLALLALPLLSSAAPKPATNPTVTIASGVVVGTATRVSNQPTVTGLANAYLGIPFAQSPPLRFAPPSPPKPWTNPLLAQKNPPACLQQFLPGNDGVREATFFNNPGLPPPPESEDCLYLNVFAPRDASPSKLKPVMFWVFGGNLQIGTASLAYYNGSSYAVNHDVVVVAVNYRTNMFGFSNSPEVAHNQQNSGFLDIRFGLQWVQDNIKKFGGDPAKVTIFGESAGGNCVKQLLAQPPSPLPFRAAIMESEATAATGNGLVSYTAVAVKFGCALSLSPLNCLRKVDGKAIQKFITDNALNFFPVNDNTNVGYNSLPSILSGQFANVPILMGTNKNEGTVFAEIFGLGSDLDIISDILQPLGIPLLNDVKNKLISTYLASGVANTSSALVSQIITDTFFTCPASTLSTAISKRPNNSPIWRYRYDASFPNTATFPNSGAYHSSEIPAVWGTYSLNGATGNQVELSRYLQGVWTGFAKDPGGGPGWPKLGSHGGLELGVLGGKNDTTGEYTTSLAEADYPCAVLSPVLIAAGMAY